MRNTTAALAIFLTVIASGCAGSTADTGPLPDPLASGPGASTAAGAAPGDPGARPNWTHGDWFEFEVQFDNSFVALEARDRLVVSKAGPNGYELSAGSRDLGVIDTHFDDFWVGAVDANLNAVLMGTPLKLFDWPLTDGKSWDSSVVTDPFGNGPETITFQSTRVDKVVDPRGEGPGFRIEGTTPSGFKIGYTYSSRVGWITEYLKEDPAGRPFLSLRLADSGDKYEGVFHVVTREVLLERVLVTPFFVFDPRIGPQPPDRVDVQGDFTFLEEVLGVFTFDVPASGSQPALPGGGGYHIQVVNPANEPYHHNAVGTGNSFKMQVNDYEPYLKGTYTVEITGGGVGGAFVGYYAYTDQVIEFNPTSHDHHKVA